MAHTTVTAQVVIDAGLARYKDPAETQWADAELLVYLNKGIEYIFKMLIAAKSDLATTVGSVTTSATQEFALPDDLWGICPAGVSISGGITKPLGVATYEDKIRGGTTATSVDPKLYYLTADKIGLIPIPNATSAAAYTTLSIRYWKKPSALALTGNMPYLNIFNDAIAAFVDAMAFLRNQESAEIVMQIYNTLEQAVMLVVKNHTPEV